MYASKVLYIADEELLFECIVYCNFSLGIFVLPLCCVNKAFCLTDMI